jgi:menaquinone-specific isochorismate synthase
MRTTASKLESLQDNLEILKGELRDNYVSQKKLKSSGNRVIIRIERKIDLPDMEELLDKTSEQISLFWSSRDKPFEIIGLDRAHHFTCNDIRQSSGLFSRISKTLSLSDPGIKCFGGIRFDAAVPVSKEWNSFAGCYFFIPQVEVVKEPGSSKLVLNFLQDQDIDEVVTKIENIISYLSRVSAGHNNSVSKPVSRMEIPGKERWESYINEALELIKRNQFQKIVLARKTNLRFIEKPDSVKLLIQLIKNSDNAFHFYLKFGEDVAFLGATPELLFGLQNQIISSEAIAGTRSRGNTEIEDGLLAEEMLSDEKEIREHRWVSEQVYQSLSEICKQVNVLEKESVIKLKNLQHLCSRFSGLLKKNISISKMIEALHPTSAVGGYPKNNTWHKIYELEGFDRGWYAGPVGWIGKNAAEIAVAIRSALVHDREINLYAGSGIVRGSDPEKEWQEIEKKILNFTQILMPS